MNQCAPIKTRQLAASLDAAACHRRAAAMAEQMVVEGDVRHSQLPTRAATVARLPPPFALSP